MTNYEITHSYNLSQIDESDDWWLDMRTGEVRVNKALIDTDVKVGDFHSILFDEDDFEFERVYKVVDIVDNVIVYEFVESLHNIKY